MSANSIPTPPPSAVVSLVFPPQVFSSFGAYYPAMAVLAGHLQAQGYAVAQEDLNSRLFARLLDPDHLEQFEEGFSFNGTDFAATSSPAMAARVIRRLDSPFHDEHGRVRGSYTTYNPRMLLHWLCQPYRVDESVHGCLSDSFSDSDVFHFYRRFFLETDYMAWLQGAKSVKLVGISTTMAPQLGPALVLARCIRDVRPDVRIVFGGSTFSLMSMPDLSNVLEHAAVDAIVRFEGERPLLTLCEQACQGVWNPEHIPGVASRSNAGVVTVNPAQAGPSLDELAFPVYDKAILAQLADPILSVIQARGCYWGECSYCDYVELYEGNPPYRTRTAERFVDEMQHQMAEHGIRRFTYVTEALPPSFARKSGQLIIDRGLDVKWGSFVMVERRFTDDTFALMRRSGCERIVVGVETMTDRVLKVVRKASTEAEISAFLRLARDNDITVHMNIIMDLPTTTFADAMQSLASFRAHLDCVADINLFRFEATRSAEIGRHPEKFGLRVISPQSNDEAVESWHSEYPSNHLHVEDPAMTDDERAEVYRRYEGFVHELYTRKFLQSEFSNDFMLDAEDRTTPVRIATESVDILSDGEDDLHCFQWHRGLQFDLRGARTALWDMVLLNRSLTGDEIVKRFSDPAVGEANWQQMVDNCMLLRGASTDQGLFDLLGLTGKPAQPGVSMTHARLRRVPPFKARG